MCTDACACAESLLSVCVNVCVSLECLHWTALVDTINKMNKANHKKKQHLYNKTNKTRNAWKI